MELTKDQITKINSLAPNEWQTNEQGIFNEPFGIPVKIKEPVIYMRWETGGMCGGGYHDDSYLRRYDSHNSKPDFVVLELVLKELYPTITYLQYKDIEKLIRTTSETDGEDYYGNCTDFDIEYIILSELINLLETF